MQGHGVARRFRREGVATRGNDIYAVYPCIEEENVGRNESLCLFSFSLSLVPFFENRSREALDRDSKNWPRFRLRDETRGGGLEKLGGAVWVKKDRYRAVNASDQAWWMVGQAAELPFTSFHRLSPPPSTLGASCASAFYPRGLRVIRARAERSAGEFAAAECAPIRRFRSQI